MGWAAEMGFMEKRWKTVSLPTKTVSCPHQVLSWGSHTERRQGIAQYRTSEPQTTCASRGWAIPLTWSRSWRLVSGAVKTQGRLCALHHIALKHKTREPKKKRKILKVNHNLNASLNSETIQEYFHFFNYGKVRASRPTNPNARVKEKFQTSCVSQPRSTYTAI